MDENSSPLPLVSSKHESPAKIYLIVLVTLLVTVPLTILATYLVVTNLNLSQNQSTNNTTTNSFVTDDEINQDSEEIIDLNEVTADWDTYENDFLTFRYPSDWEIIDGESSGTAPYFGNAKHYFPTIRASGGENQMQISPLGYLVFGFGGDPENEIQFFTDQEYEINGEIINYSERYLELTGESFVSVDLGGEYSDTLDGETVPFQAFFGNTYPIGVTGNEEDRDYELFLEERELFFIALSTVDLK